MEKSEMSAQHENSSTTIDERWGVRSARINYITRRRDKDKVKSKLLLKVYGIDILPVHDCKE
jgi:hypothetical protein